MSRRTPIFLSNPRLCSVVGAALVLALAGCGSSATTSLGPSSVAKCQVAVTGGPLATIGAGGGVGSVTVSAEPECAWTVSAGANWISDVTPTSGQGTGEIRFQVAPNASSATRQTDISVNGAIAAVTQAGAPCRIDITPRRQTVPAEGGTGTVTVTTLAGCSWTVTSDASWLEAQIVPPAAGSPAPGPGTVRFSARANSGGARIGHLTIGDRTFTVTQAATGAPRSQCAYTLQPSAQSMTAAAGSTSVTVEATDGCAWTATSNVSWLTVGGTEAGTGPGVVTVGVSANTGASRTGTATIAGRTFTVTQASGCAVSINPSSAAVPSSGGAGASIAVSAGPTCSWTATTATPWITVTSDASGTGNGSVGYTVGANSGDAREGTISIASNTFTVSQGASCLYALDRTNQTFGDKPGSSGPVSVTTTAECAWTSVSNDSWITVKTGAARTGSGTMTFDVSKNNSGGTRVGTLTIAGQTFTVTQTGN